VLREKYDEQLFSEALARGDLVVDVRGGFTDADNDER